VASWSALGVALACAVLAEEADLVSIVTGIGAGWLVLCAASTLIALFAVRRAFDTTPSEELAEV
jgi:hypothetical protein